MVLKSWKRRRGRTCSTYEGKQKYVQNFDEETLTKEATWNSRKCDIMYVEDID